MTPKKPIVRGFDDEDMKALEDHAEYGMYIGNVARSLMILRLLARLRASEKALTEFRKLESETTTYEKVVSLVKAWEISKGEGERNG